MSNRRLVIVTGAAGGMGSAAAAMFARQGTNLLLCDLHSEPLKRVAEQLRSQAGDVHTLAADIADVGFPDQLLEAVGHREIDALIHTAGLSPTMADATRILAVNYDATERLVEAARPRMAAGGCAVLISSSSAHMISSPEIDAALKELVAGKGTSVLAPWATSPQMAYPLSKRAVIKLVAHQAGAFGARRARIVSISPGLIDTDMGKAEQAASPQVAMILSKTPLARFGTAEEIASVAVFLCSPSASYITGCDIRVDGGSLASLGF